MKNEKEFEKKTRELETPAAQLIKWLGRALIVAICVIGIQAFMAHFKKCNCPLVEVVGGQDQPDQSQSFEGRTK